MIHNQHLVDILKRNEIFYQVKFKSYTYLV